MQGWQGQGLRYPGGLSFAGSYGGSYHFPPPPRHPPPHRPHHLIPLFQNGDTALHIAAAMGRRKLTKILLESGCDKDAKNKQNETAMDISRRKELAEIVSILQNPPPILSEKDREDQAMAARDRSQSHPRPSKSDKKREKTSTSSKENDHERGSKREKKRVSVSGQNDGPG